MATQNNTQLVLKDPDALIVWIAGAIFTLWGGVSLFFFPAKEQIFQLLNVAIAVCGLVMLLFFGYLTVTADRATRTLRLEYQYLLFRRAREIPFDDIARIHVERSGGHDSVGYRIVVTLTDGKKVPFRSTFAPEGGKTRQVARLMNFIKDKTPVRRKKAGLESSSEQPDETGGTNAAPAFEQDEAGAEAEG